MKINEVINISCPVSSVQTGKADMAEWDRCRPSTLTSAAWKISLTFFSRFSCLTSNLRPSSFFYIYFHCIQGFIVSPRLQLLKIPRRGLWSTAANKLLHPRVYFNEWSRDQARERDSPSVQEYLDLAGFVNRDPANMSFHPSLQHTGESSVHLQCFCSRTYPGPSLLHSLWMHVRLFISYHWTPSLQV